MVCKDNSVFWYIVLQDVVLKDERNCAVMNLTPQQMILVDMLWLLGPNMVLAQVVSPAKGYVPCERNTCGQLITRLNPLGGQVPQTLLEIEEENTSHKLSYPFLGNKRVRGSLISSENHNQRTLFQSYPLCNKPVKSSKRSQQPPDHLYVDSCKASNQYTENNWSKAPCYFFDSSLVAQESRIGEWEAAHPYCSLHTQPLQSRKSLKQRLMSIYHSNERCIQTDYGKDTQNVKELHNGGTWVGKPMDANMNVTPLYGYRKDWRWDNDRWVTVSALCHALQVICNTNEYKVRSKHFQPNMIFNSVNVPKISLPAYLKRIAWFLGCSSACFVLALEYIHRLANHCSEIEVNHNSVHAIVMTCILVATKFVDDKQFKNTFYARLAGLSVLNLSAFEVQLVFFLKFDLSVFPDQYNARYAAMVADNQGPSMVLIRPEGITVGGNATQVARE